MGFQPWAGGSSERQQLLRPASVVMRTRPPPTGRRALGLHTWPCHRPRPPLLPPLSGPGGPARPLPAPASRAPARGGGRVSPLCRPPRPRRPRSPRLHCCLGRRCPPGRLHTRHTVPAALPPASLWTYCVHSQEWGPGEARGVCFLLRCPLHRRVAPCPGQCSELRPRSPAGARGGGDQAHLEQSPGAARPHALPRFPHCAVPGSPGAVCLGWGLFLSCLYVLGSESLEK